MLKRLCFNILIFALLVLPTLALDVDKTSISVSLKINEQYKETITVLNDENKTLEVYISDLGNISDFTWLDPTYLEIPALSSKQFTVLLAPTQSGYFSGKIALIVNTSYVKNISVEVNVSKWIWETVDWFTYGKYKIDPTLYEIEIVNVSLKVNIKVYKGGSLVSWKDYEVGQEAVFDEIYFKVLDRYDDWVKLEVKTIYSDTTISKVKEVATAQTGEFSFYITEYGNRFLQGTVTKESFILRNGLNVPVKLKQITYDGVLTTPEGKKPIRIEQWSLVTLQPNEEQTFIVVIDTTDLEPAEWKPTLTVVGLTPDGSIVKASIRFSILIVPSTISPAEQKEPTIQYPSEIEPNQEFMISVLNIPPDATVWMFPNPNLVGTSISFEEGKWVWRGYINSTEDQEITISLMRYGGIMKTWKFVIRIPVPFITVSPKFPKAGDLISVEPKGVKVEVYEDNILQTTFFYQQPFVAEGGKKYCFSKGDLYQCIRIPKPYLSLSITPLEPEEGEDIVIKCRAYNKNLTSPPTISIDGETYNQYEVTVRLEKGTYTVKCSARGFEPAEKILYVEKTIKVSGPREVLVGKEAVFNFSEPIDLVLKLNGREIERKSGVEVFSFVPKEVGLYDIYADGTLIHSFRATKPKPTGFFALVEQAFWLIIVGIFIILIIVILATAKPKRREIGFRFTKQPTKPSGEVEEVEE